VADLNGDGRPDIVGKPYNPERHIDVWFNETRDKPGRLEGESRMDLQGATIVVTGAARGIGLAITECCAQRGAKVAMADVLTDDLAASAARLQSAGAAVLPIVADVTDAEQVEAMVTRAERELGPIDALINNAATFSYVGPLWEASPETWFRDIRVGLFGSFLCCRSVLRRMVPRGRGYVINMVSSGGVGDPHAYSTGYACAKTALMRLTEGLAKEVAPHGIKAFALAPPAVHTEMTQFIMDDPGGRRWRPEFHERFADGRAFHPASLLGRWTVDLLSGTADALTGRYFLATRDFEEVVAQAETILKDDLMTLRIR
jgi:NAD(P)-dependent dehydrogenase (short-subunit alcohol dehydrogenase family)